MFNNSTLDMFYGNNNSDESRVVEWLNNATLSSNSNEKVEFLLKVQEVILNKSPELLLKYLGDVLQFTSDRDSDAKKWVVSFIEDACKKNQRVFEIAMQNLYILLNDTSVQVQKRVIQAASSIFKNMLIWIAKVPLITNAVEDAWSYMSKIKLEILNMIDSDNDGIRTHSVKFLEGVVLLQTYPEPSASRKENDFSLADIPLTLKIARRRKLEEEANHIFTLLLKFHGSPHISSVNLMACMGAVCNIAKLRPEFMPRVITAMEALLVKLPPTLTPSQVSSVKKHMKLQMMNILKHPSSYDMQESIVNILSELGATNQEIQRATPKITEQQKKKYSKRNLERMASPVQLKRPRLETNDVVESTEPMEVESNNREAALKVTEQFIFESLNPESVTELVMETMPSLPLLMPPHFQSNYTPVVNAGTVAQTQWLSKLLAVQFLDAGVGPGVRLNLVSTTTASREPTVDIAVVKPTSVDEEMREIKKEILDTDEEIKMKKEEEKRKAKQPKSLRLDQVTKPLTLDVRDNLLEKSVRRILSAEQAAFKSGATILRNKIITTLASTFGQSIRDIILRFVTDDLKSQIDLALAWLYEEYSYMQGFNRMVNVLRKEEKPDYSYNSLLCSLLTHLETDQDQDHLMTRLILEAPLLTEESVDILKRICVQENRCISTMSLLYDLVFRRPTKSMTFVNVLLHHTSNESITIRAEALKYITKLYAREEFQSVIEEQAIVYLDFLTQVQPPPILFGEDCGRPLMVDTWTEESCKACLYLYLALLPIKESLIHELSRIYIQTPPDTKRVILRLLEQPVRGMGMDSPDLLTLVERCPKGAETLVTRVIHILTDRGAPSPILVAKVRDLYQTRVSDVRFLIPVLTGLTKKEIIAALPKLIKLNPIVMKEVFNRLLANHAEGPITPAELLIALHTIDSSKADLKTVMKATSLCFNEKSIYTQEVLAVVIQQLMDISPLPTLLMRTVIQALSLYPRLSGFVMNVLQRLIIKQVWKQKVVWEGFVKCCQRTRPQSFQVLLQLPSVQLSEALVLSPELRQPLLEHVNALTDTQRAHIPSSVVDVLNGQGVANNDVVVAGGGDPTVSSTVPLETTSDIPPTEPLPPGMD